MLDCFELYINNHTIIIDTVLIGNLNAKVVHLVTQKTDILKKNIKEELGLEGIILKGNELFDNQDKKMILIVVKV